MNRNYSNVDKQIWRVRYVYEHCASDRNNAECLTMETFHQKPGIIVICENVLTNKPCANLQSLVTKQLIFVSRRNSIEKERRNFCLQGKIFFAKFDLYIAAFQFVFADN